MTTPVEDAELIINWMVTPNVEDACHNMPATVFYACYRLARAYKKEQGAPVIYSNQNVTINQGENRLRVEFGDVKLEMSHQQAADVARQILERCEDGQRCCGTCFFWSSSAGAAFGRCTAPAPEWVTREGDSMNQMDGTQCTLWQK